MAVAHQGAGLRARARLCAAPAAGRREARGGGGTGTAAGSCSSTRAHGISRPTTRAATSRPGDRIEEVRELSGASRHAGGVRRLDEGDGPRARERRGMVRGRDREAPRTRSARCSRTPRRASGSTGRRDSTGTMPGCCELELERCGSSPARPSSSRSTPSEPSTTASPPKPSRPRRSDRVTTRKATEADGHSNGSYGIARPGSRRRGGVPAPGHRHGRDRAARRRRVPHLQRASPRADPDRGPRAPRLRPRRARGGPTPRRSRTPGAG